MTKISYSTITPTGLPRRHGQCFQATVEPEISIPNSTLCFASTWNSTRFGQCSFGQRESPSLASLRIMINTYHCYSIQTMNLRHVCKKKTLTHYKKSWNHYYPLPLPCFPDAMVGVYKHVRIRRSVYPSLQYTQRLELNAHWSILLWAERVQARRRSGYCTQVPNYSPNLPAIPFKPGTSDTYASIMKPRRNSMG